MNYFLAKTDPETYSIDDLARDHKTTWDGVRNPAARLHIKSMKVGDVLFIYHSQGEAQIVGLARVTSEARYDAKDPKSSVINVEFICKLNPEDYITLREIKDSHEFDDWLLVRQGRLSTMPVPEKFLQWPKVRKILAKINS